MRRTLVFAILGLWPAAALAGPQVQSPLQAVAMLRAAKSAEQAEAAVSRVTAACRGKLRHALRDHPGLLSAASKMAAAEDPGVRRQALDLDRCFTPAKFVTVVAPRLADEAPEVVTYAAEVAARMADPVVVPPLLERLAAKKAACLEAGLEAPQQEICVWLTYAPGAALGSADRDTRAKAAEAAAAMFASPYPKVREVAVETVAAARLKAHARAVKTLIEAEKAGKYAKPNDSALLGRFAKRRKALLAGD